MKGFRNDELVLVNGQWHPLVGGRLRVAHDANEKMSVKTEVIHFLLGVEAVVRCEIVTAKGTFSATGTASASRDAEFAEAVIEVAETRSVTRALRWAGYSTDVGAEELGGKEGLVLRASPVPIRRDTAEAKHRPGPASSAQLRCIRTLARRLGQEPDAAIAEILPGVTMAQLTLPAASKVIDALKSATAPTGEARRAP